MLSLRAFAKNVGRKSVRRLSVGKAKCEVLPFAPPPIADSLSEELSSAREKTSKPITVLRVGVRILFSLDPVGIVVLFAVVPSEGVL
ncbi:hypothetical protein PVK06_049902 [Gossypium arboreum]|uniref:Uncharacterized protein n=1 Tax=Gossypium arboreum TaxID=29729 RepID=A0ABR0MBC0_GOSAR|nr:hypothetical protein PVK06_049902 [Gossypium arboreum]